MARLYVSLNLLLLVTPWKSKFAVIIYPSVKTWRDIFVFAEDAGGGQVFDREDQTFVRKAGTSWRKPGWRVEDSQPVLLLIHN
jgi:hypothetical protein